VLLPHQIAVKLVAINDAWRRGNQMSGINTFIFKITSFCNLNCTYCYVFNAGDTSYLRRPRVMPLETAQAALSKIASYAIRTGIHHVYIVLHGGEPMLAGKEWLKQFARMAQSLCTHDVELIVSMQTNGLLLDNAWLDLLVELNISFGISLDGPEEVNDRARVNHAGKGSYRQIIDALHKVNNHSTARNRFGGILCVVDPSQDGRMIYQHFRSLGISRIDFIMPHDYNWDRLPPYFGTERDSPIADYLIPIFDNWWEENNPSVKIRMFEVILSLAFGKRKVLDSLGGFPLEEAVIEADGSFEPLDVLKECGDGFTDIGLNIVTNSFEDFLGNRLIQLALRGNEGLSETCKSCALHDICGGGYLPHRYGAGREFQNPSIHCKDLWRLITHIISAASRACTQASATTLPAQECQESTTEATLLMKN
jgi:uncharacterized protein